MLAGFFKALGTAQHTLSNCESGCFEQQRERPKFEKREEKMCRVDQHCCSDQY